MINKGVLVFSIRFDGGVRDIEVSIRLSRGFTVILLGIHHLLSVNLSCLIIMIILSDHRFANTPKEKSSIVKNTGGPPDAGNITMVLL